MAKVEYYTASSVINVLKNHPLLSVVYSDPSYPVPSCPKTNNFNANCVRDFPNCDGKGTCCSQKLRLKNKRGNSVFVQLFYFIKNQNNSPIKEGRIKKGNATLSLIKTHYGLNEAALTDA